MKSEVQYQLLQELIKLRRRFGSEAFHQLARLLNDGSLVADLAAITATLPASKPRNVKSRYPLNKTDLVSKEITRLESAPSKKNKIIALFLRDVQEKRILRSLSSLQMFAREIGIRAAPTDKSRSAIIQSALKSLEKSTIKDVQRYLKLASQLDSSPSQLAEWTQIIVKGER